MGTLSLQLDANCLANSFLVFKHLVRLTSMEAPGHSVYL